MRDLNFSLKQLCLNNPDGSHSTQAARLRCLNLIANQLHDLKFFHMLSSSLKPKHVDALLNLWHQQSISVGTIKNRLAHLRWWAHKTKKDGLIPSLNSQLHIPARSYVPDTSKAFSLTEQHLNLISDPFVRCSLLLQAAFGLRREEAIKFIPSWADHGDSIHLKGSWCKGGQPRSIPITNDNQRVVLDMAHSIAGKSSLIPSHRSYIQHLKVYESQCSRAGILNPHGLRHLYAQLRFFQLTGSLCSFSLNSLHTTSLEPDDISFNDNLDNLDTSIINDNLDNLDNLDSSTKLSDDQKHLLKLSPQQKELYKQARLTISKELGHHRLQVTSVYLGKPLTNNQPNPLSNPLTNTSKSLTNNQSKPVTKSLTNTTKPASY